MHSRKTRIKRSHFTLVELLVVMGIIVILMSIMLPALRRARMSAKEIGCRNNMKQFGIGFQVLVQDGPCERRSGYFPFWLAQTHEGWKNFYQFKI